jgi:Tfp pilus assembly protein PilO
MYAEWPIGLQIDGTYNDLGSFLERVSKFPRIINVTGIHIRTKAATGLSSATISADCTATTFVLLEPKAATTAAAVPAAAPRTE